MRILMCVVAVAMSVGGMLTAEPLMDAADVVVLGEVHDNPEHHRLQADYITRLAPRAVVFEMLTPDQAAKVSVDETTNFTELADVLDWSESGWPDFEIYQPVFERLEGIAVYGAAVPRALVRNAFSEGAASVFGEDAARFGLDQPLPADQLQLRKQMQFAAHCEAMALEMMGGMVEAQRLRDAAFAKTTLRALQETGGPVVLITGNGHARTDWAVPYMIAQAAPEIAVFSIGITEQGTDPAPYDLHIATAPAMREDPCLKLRE